MIRRPPISTLFPYTGALPIFLLRADPGDRDQDVDRGDDDGCEDYSQGESPPGIAHLPARRRDGIETDKGDRKSTRLNSSHANISYAVFCLKNNVSHTALCFVP